MPARRIRRESGFKREGARRRRETVDGSKGVRVMWFAEKEGYRLLSPVFSWLLPKEAKKWTAQIIFLSSPEYIAIRAENEIVRKCEVIRN